MKTLVLLLISVATFACATQKNGNHSSADFTKIRFGSGGGFTGLKNEYLIQNAKVFKATADSLTELNKIKAKDLRSLRKELKELDFDNIELNETGNMTYFIEIETLSTKKEISWTDQTDNDSVKQLYKNLVKTIEQN